MNDNPELQDMKYYEEATESLDWNNCEYAEIKPEDIVTPSLSDKSIDAINSALNLCPDFVNEEGVKWWKEKHLTQHAREGGELETPLPDIAVWKVEKTNGNKVYLVVQDGEPIYENQVFEAVAVHIDMMKAQIKFNKKECDL